MKLSFPTVALLPLLAAVAVNAQDRYCCWNYDGEQCDPCDADCGFCYDKADTCEATSAGSLCGSQDDDCCKDGLSTPVDEICAAFTGITSPDGINSGNSGSDAGKVCDLPPLPPPPSEAPDRYCCWNFENEAPCDPCDPGCGFCYDKDRTCAVTSGFSLCGGGDSCCGSFGSDNFVGSLTGACTDFSGIPGSGGIGNSGPNSGKVCDLPPAPPPERPFPSTGFCCWNYPFETCDPCDPMCGFCHDQAGTCATIESSLCGANNDDCCGSILNNEPVAEICESFGVTAPNGENSQSLGKTCETTPPPPPPPPTRPFPSTGFCCWNYPDETCDPCDPNCGFCHDQAGTCSAIDGALCGANNDDCCADFLLPQSVAETCENFAVTASNGENSEGLGKTCETTPPPPPPPDNNGPYCCWNYLEPVEDCDPCDPGCGFCYSKADTCTNLGATLCNGDQQCCGVLGTPFSNEPLADACVNYQGTAPNGVPSVNLGKICQTHSGGGGNDPHFKTFGGQWFDYHGECDLVLLACSHFGKGLGLVIHIRTKARYEYSYIESAAIQIGNDGDILEVSGFGSYMLNGISQAQLPETMSSNNYTVTYEQKNDKEHAFTIHIAATEKIVVSTFKDWVMVRVLNGAYANFAGSVGLMGDFVTGAMLARDGHTHMENRTARSNGDGNGNAVFGQEWQVLPDEPKLFQVADRSPQYPQKCILPEEKAEGRRRLGSSSIGRDAAEEACSRLSDATSRSMCVFDVLQSGDLEVASAAATF